MEEMKHEPKNETKNGMKNGTKNEIKNETEAGMKNEISKEIRGGMRGKTEIAVRDKGWNRTKSMAQDKVDSLIDDVWLDRIRLSPTAKYELSKKYGGSRGVRLAGAEEICYAATGLTLKAHPKAELWERLFHGDTGPAERQLCEMEKKKIRAVCREDDAYPDALKNISDPPWMLYYRGTLSCCQTPGMAVVGARRCTDYGRRTAEQLGRTLGRAGVTVVSGMAGGVDSAAHRGALAGAREHAACTAAVFGCGVDICYPKANADMLEQIAARGVVLSEFIPGTWPKPYFFPMRNRIISGLSSGVVVVEAGLKSGSLITAACAAEQGRDVYAVPGNIDREASVGTNQLLRDGAIPITAPVDILYGMDLQPENFTESIQKQLGTDEMRIYNEVLREGEIGVGELACRLELSAGSVNALVTILEMKGILRTGLGKIFIAKS